MDGKSMHHSGRDCNLLLSRFLLVIGKSQSIIYIEVHWEETYIQENKVWFLSMVHYTLGALHMVTAYQQDSKLKILI